MSKLTNKDVRMSQVLKLAPWISVLVSSLPGPIIFIFLLITASSTDSAAVYLFLAGLSLALGFAFGLIIAAALLLYRRMWLSRLRERLASDGITASEVVWFRSELTSAERKSLKEIEQSNPVLADAYLETLAARLTASRILSRSKREMMVVERRLNRARTLETKEALGLQEDLTADREKLDQLRQQAVTALSKARTRLQEIEATASRKLNQEETALMMQRLGSTQDQLPLVLEMAQLERQALKEADSLANTIKLHQE